MENLYEELASIEHQRWADWQKFMMTESFEIMSNRISSEGEFVLLKIPTKYWKNWERQIKTPYSKLAEYDKDKDREQVDRYVPLIIERIKRIQASDDNGILEFLKGQIIKLFKK